MHFEGLLFIVLTQLFVQSSNDLKKKNFAHLCELLTYKELLHNYFPRQRI